MIRIRPDPDSPQLPGSETLKMISYPAHLLLYPSLSPSVHRYRPAFRALTQQQSF